LTSWPSLVLLLPSYSGHPERIPSQGVFSIHSPLASNQHDSFTILTSPPFHLHSPPLSRLLFYYLVSTRTYYKSPFGANSPTLLPLCILATRNQPCKHNNLPALPPSLTHHGPATTIIPNPTFPPPSKYFHTYFFAFQLAGSRIISRITSIFSTTLLRTLFTRGSSPTNLNKDPPPPNQPFEPPALLLHHYSTPSKLLDYPS
jgi:hypothetical protein